MIFPKLIQELTVQVDDMTRFDMGKTFVTSDEGNILSVEITFDQITYHDVFVDLMPEKWFLDYAFNVDAVTPVFVRVKTDTTPGGLEKEFSITVVTDVDDALFSNDSQLFDLETELKDFIPHGRTSFNYAHRQAQRNIIRDLDGQGIRTVYGVAFTKDKLVGNPYISEFSVYETLMLIFEDLKVRDNDVFTEKKKAYMSSYTQAAKNARLNLDYNDDGTIDDNEIKNTQSKFLTR